MNTLRKKLLLAAGNWFLRPVISVLCKSLKIEYKNYTQVESLMNSGQNFIIAFWHGKMLLPWYIFRDRSYTALISRSKDGNLLANLLHSWNYRLIRGSSRDGSKEAFNKSSEAAAEGNTLLITPDGPTGPPHKMKAGAVIISQRNNIPIILLGIGYSEYYSLKSWDKFMIPKPFSKAVCVFSDPAIIEKNDDRDKTDLEIKMCEELLQKIDKEAEDIVKYN
ncbi:MAG: lysophospholipid acyltransferase family protein [Melioribacteraceae bacterium]|nr:lysophospholipid acyltransferase family protein [Melioribacteraceae bacterium]